MHSLFRVAKSDVQQLNDEQARELIARLCQAEMRKNGLSSSCVMWGGNQRAKDGGVDVRVKVDHAVELAGYIPRANTIFQVKAVKAFTAATIMNEMTPEIKDQKPPSRQLLSRISELAQYFGSYIIASTKGDHSDSEFRARKSAMESCIDTAGLSGRIHLDFYDSQKISSWAEEHPAIVIWIKSLLGIPASGWKPYGPWAYREQDVHAEYILDDKVKIIAPSSDEPITIAEAIKRIRQDLSQKKSSVRIVGLSGVGKTRLVQALFDKRIVPDSAALDHNGVIYTDFSDNPSPQPNALVENLLIDSADVVVIVDNCGAETHNKLTELIRREESKIRLVTLEYDIQDDLPDQTQCYRLETSSIELVKQLLERLYSELTPNDISKIAEFSGGNARVAFALADASESKGQLSKLENRELFVRLFRQKKDNDENLLRSAEVCSLLYSFDAEDTNPNSELALLASLAEVTTPTLNRQVTELQRRGLVQQRGKWKAVLPHAISNRLAGDALENNLQNLLLQTFVNKDMPRLLRSFSHRLSFLHDSEVARKIAAEWLDPDGLCGDLAMLDEAGQHVFSYIAPVNQSATLNALMRASQCAKFISVKNIDRRHFIHVARSLAYEEKYFDQATTILLRFSVVEPSDFNNNAARSELKSLFSCHLSGTLTSPLQRANVVKQLIQASDPIQTKLGIELLMAALRTGQFTSHSNFDFGARSRGFGWHPKTSDDVIEWYSTFITIALEAGKTADASGLHVRESFASQFRGLWSWTGVDLNAQLANVAESFHSIDGWAYGWKAIRDTLRYGKKRMTENSLIELTRLEMLLAPKDLAGKIRTQILCDGRFDDSFDDGGSDTTVDKYQAWQEKLEQLGILAGKDTSLVTDFLPSLLKTNSQNTFRFACGVAQAISDIQMLLANAKEIVVKTEPSVLELTFVFGLINGWNKIDVNAVSDFLDNAVDDPTWGRFFPNLQSEVALDDVGYTRLMRAIELGNAQIWRYKCLQYGRTTVVLSVAQVMALISSIAKKPEGAYVAIELLSMVIFNAKEKDGIYSEELANRCIYFFQAFNWQSLGNTSDIFKNDLKEILEFSLKSPIADENVELILQRLIDFERTPNMMHSYDFKVCLEPFFQYHATRTLDLIYQIDDNGSYESALDFLNDRYLSFHETPFFQPPLHIVLAWCAKSPRDRFSFIAQVCPLFNINQSNVDDGTIIEFSEIAKNIFHYADFKESILDIFVGRFVPSSWSGSLPAIIRSRIPALDQLNLVEDPKITQLIANAKATLEEKAEIEAKWDEERNQIRNVRFE